MMIYKNLIVEIRNLKVYMLDVRRILKEKAVNNVHKTAIYQQIYLYSKIP